MLRWQRVATGCASALLAACAPSAGETKPSRAENLSSLTITMVRTGCYGACPRYGVEITGDGAVTCCGVNFVRESGERSRKVDLSKISELAQAVEAADFFELQDEYIATVTDNPTTVILVSYKGREKSLSDYVGSSVGMPHAVVELEDAIDEIAGTSEWIGDPWKNEMSGASWPDCGTKYFDPPEVIEPVFK